METIAITIKEGGKVTVEVTGVKGRSCTELTRAIENALGAGKQKLTPEYYEKEQVNRQRLGLGG